MLVRKSMSSNPSQMESFINQKQPYIYNSVHSSQGDGRPSPLRNHNKEYRSGQGHGPLTMIGHAMGHKKMSDMKPAVKRKFFGFKMRTQSIITQNFRHTPRNFTPIRSGTLNPDVMVVQHFDLGTYNQNSAEHVA